MYRTAMKILHELSAAGMLGGLATCIVLLLVSSPDSLPAYAAMRRGIEAVTHWVVLPSLALVLVSGLLATAGSHAYLNAGWAWVKAALGLTMFEGTLVTVQGSAQRLAEMASAAAASGTGVDALAPLLRTEWYGLWTMLVLSIANVLIGVWRPRLQWRVRSSPRGG